MLTMGGRYLGGNASFIEFSFSEAPNTTGAPDLMAAAGYGPRF